MTGPGEDPLEVVILDVGHGNCAVVRDGDTSVVVDIPRKSQIISALTRQDCSTVKHLLLSHADEDHIGGAVRLLSHNDINIGTLWTNPNAVQDSQTYIDLLTLAADKFNRGELAFKSNLNVGANGELDFRRVNIDIIHPDVVHAGIGQTAGRHRMGSISSNRMSAVLRVRLDGNPAVLLPGDVDDKGFRSIIKRGVDISAPVLVFPHHGGSANVSNERDFARRLCEHVRPEMVVFSLGRMRFRNPLPEIIAGVREAVPQAHIACTQLSLRCHEDEIPEAVQSHILPEWPSDGQGRRACCAGTIVVGCKDGQLTYAPQRNGHVPFIRKFVKMPQCLGEPSMP